MWSSFRQRVCDRRDGQIERRKCAGLRFGKPARTPIAPVERIDSPSLDLVRLVVPDSRKGEILNAVDFQPAGHTERAIDREDFTGRPRNDLGLKPAVLGAFARMELPDEISSDSP